jgi:hypothetical protein
MFCVLIPRAVGAKLYALVALLSPSPRAATPGGTRYPPLLVDNALLPLSEKGPDAVGNVPENPPPPVLTVVVSEMVRFSDFVLPTNTLPNESVLPLRGVVLTVGA